ncbi:MAG: CHAT domain-containing protein [Saprospiraceae bacterium]|nr:CHAT domain-containing protein [Saprospiraceae bacterium]
MARALLDQGMLHYRDRKFDSAYQKYDLALELFAKAGTVEQLADAYVWRGNTNYRLQNMNQAISDYHQAAEIYLTIYDSNHVALVRPYKGLSGAHYALGNAHDASHWQHLSHLITLEYYGEEDIQSAISYYNLGTEALNYGAYRRSLSYFLKALPIYLKEYSAGHERLSSLFVNMGIIYDKMGDVERAAEYYHKANEIDIGMHGEDYWLLAYNYLNLGKVYRQIDQDSIAADCFNTSVRIADANDLYEVLATGYYDLGLIEQKAGNYAAAEDLYQQAVMVLIEALGERHHQLNQYYGSLAEIELERGELSNAQKYLELAIEIVEETFSDKHPQIGEHFSALAKVAIARGNFSKAHKYIESGISSLYPAGSNWSIDSLEYANALNSGVLLQLILTRAAIFEHQQRTTGNPEDLLAALGMYETASEIIDYRRRSFVGEGSKELLQSSVVAIFERAIRLCIDLQQVTGNNRFLAMAFNFAEKNKSVILAEALGRQVEMSMKDVPPELLRGERDLTEKISYARTKLLNDPTSPELRRALDQLEFSYDSLVNHISQFYPHYFDLKYNLSVSAVDDVQSRLREDQALLSFFEGNSNWFVFRIDRDSAALHQVSKTELSNDELLTFREISSNPVLDFQADLAYHIYHQLIGVSVGDKSYQELIIVPDGILGHCPFDALLLQPGSSAANFLIYRFVISFSNSATLFCRGTAELHANAIDYAGFAPSYRANPSGGDLRDMLANLPHARDEVIAGAKIFNGKTFLDEEASEINFVSLDPKPAILHLAMHAWIDDQQPIYSRLIFSHSSDTLEDGNLNAYEIFDLDLGSQLTLLSACNTGYGMVRKGEGIMSLSRAFMYAGCSNIVMSLWQARDRPTTTIITSFLRKLKSGTPKNAALREAKLDYLEAADPFESHPANWASLVLVGDTEPIFLGGSNVWIYTLIGLALITFLIWRNWPARYPQS